MTCAPLGAAGVPVRADGVLEGGALEPLGRGDEGVVDPGSEAAVVSVGFVAVGVGAVTAGGGFVVALTVVLGVVTVAVGVVIVVIGVVTVGVVTVVPVVVIVVMGVVTVTVGVVIVGVVIVVIGVVTAVVGRITDGSVTVPGAAVASFPPRPRYASPKPHAETTRASTVTRSHLGAQHDRTQRIQPLPIGRSVEMIPLYTLA